jgi:hypothetical protein
MRGLVVWLTLSAVGTLIVVLPDEGPRLFSLSAGHGPSVIDALGVGLLLVGWLAFLIPLLRSRSEIARPGLLGTLALAGLATVTWSVVTDSGLWWVLGAVLLFVIQVVAALGVIRRDARPEGSGT